VRGRILIVDDDLALCEVLEAGLTRREFEPACATSADAALLAMEQREFDTVLTDLNMSGMSGLDLCRRIVESHPGVLVIVITAFGSLETAVAAIRAGAYDFVTKPIDVDALALSLDRAVQHRALREEVKRLRQTLADNAQFNGLIGESAPMRALRSLLIRVAESDASVLLTGETGTGKEVVARVLHDSGRRKQAPFVALNCAALPEPLLESELFGHVKGAFTDAKSDHRGLFQQADGGTLFLDEIGALPLGLQPKLLRALQERRVRQVGGDREIAVDVRIIAATNQDLRSAVDEGHFREDLFFRVNVVHVELPPLRSRGNDVLLLAQHFSQVFAARSEKRVLSLSSTAAQKLLDYSWPGNVRELQNCIERAVTLTSYDHLGVDDLPERIREYRHSHVLVVSESPADLVSMDEVERRYILRVLEALGGNRTQAARVLGFDRKTLYRKLDRILPDTHKSGDDHSQP
jgi:two-component system, NtrC family, response regulator AtoC